MTTTVIVKANHGWPVDVTAIPLGPVVPAAMPVAQRVEIGTERVFHVHSGQDLLIHEVQPSELSKSA